MISHHHRMRLAALSRMPEKATLKRARAHLRRGDAPSTAAGEFIREEIEHIRHGKHGARSTKQAIAIGLSKARRAGIPLEDPRAGASKQAKRQARRERAAGKHPHKPDARRSRAMVKALKREPHTSASKQALSQHAKLTAKQALATRRRHARTGATRSASAVGKRAAATRKLHARQRSAAAKRGAATRNAHARKRSAAKRASR